MEKATDRHISFEENESVCWRMGPGAGDVASTRGNAEVSTHSGAATAEAAACDRLLSSSRGFKGGGSRFVYDDEDALCCGVNSEVCVSLKGLVFLAGPLRSNFTARGLGWR